MTAELIKALPRPRREPTLVVVDDVVDVVEQLDVTVVLPCWNEEASVRPCVEEALQAIAAAGWTGEVVVVDNNSTDGSAAAALAAGARVVEESVPGYGAALLKGIRSARGAVVVMADADCTYPLNRLAEIVRPVIAGEADLMLGSRLDSATRNSMPFLHRFVGTPALTWLVREGSGVTGLSDSQSGFRAFPKDLIDRTGLRSTGMEFASEMLIRAAQRNLIVCEIPLGYRPRVGESKLSTWRDGLRHLRLILRLSPHLLLWQPGLLAMILGVFTYLISVINPAGTSVGSITWQPIFFGTVFLVLGLIATLSGALLAYHSPAASARTRAAFAWVGDPRFLRWAMNSGASLALLGLAIDGLLFGEWISGAPNDPTSEMHIAGVAQGLILTGSIMVAFAGLYRLLSREAVMRVALVSPVEDA